MQSGPAVIAKAAAAGAGVAEAALMWTPVQRMYRHMMCAVRNAHYTNRAEMFWARHRVKVEIYKYAHIDDTAGVLTTQLVQVGEEVAQFMELHMRVSVQRIIEHNDTLARLPVEEAKRFRAKFVEKEKEHASWCKQKIRRILQKRPPPPYPYC